MKIPEIKVLQENLVEGNSSKDKQTTVFSNLKEIPEPGLGRELLSPEMFEDQSFKTIITFKNLP